MLNIYRSQRFQDELAEYNRVLSKLHMPEHKRRFQALIDDLRSHALLINEAHSSANDGKLSPKSIRENIASMAEIRSELKTLCKGL